MRDAFNRARSAHSECPTPETTMALRQTIVAVCRREVRRHDLGAELRGEFEALSKAASESASEQLTEIANRVVEACYELDRGLAAGRPTVELAGIPLPRDEDRFA